MKLNIQIHHVWKIVPICLLSAGLAGCGADVKGVQCRLKGEPCDNINLCLSGLYCEKGFCRAVCNNDFDCGSNGHCVNSRCIDDNGNNNNPQSCPAGFTGDKCSQCLSEHYGPTCEPCNCGQHGRCDDTLTGTGICYCEPGWEGDHCEHNRVCDEGFDGENCELCAKDYYGDRCQPCDCLHGECWDGKSGNGLCKGDCEANWSGPKCDTCTNDMSGENCDKPKTCINGTPNLGVNGDGHCLVCDGEWSGSDCDEPKKCVNGTPNLGITGDGHCSRCSGYWSGPDCDLNILCNPDHGTPNLGVDGDGHCQECVTGWGLPDCDKCQRGFISTADACLDCSKESESFGTAACSYKDTRDAQNPVVYNIVRIGSQLWMRENMRYSDAGITCHANTKRDSDFVNKYGCLYSHDHAETVCPDGWRLPTNDEFNTLLKFVRANGDTNGASLRAENWDNGQDTYGFTALPAGRSMQVEKSTFIDGNCYIWGAATAATDNDLSAILSVTNTSAATGGYHDDSWLSVRCIKDIE